MRKKPLTIKELGLVGCIPLAGYLLGLYTISGWHSVQVALITLGVVLVIQAVLYAIYRTHRHMVRTIRQANRGTPAAKAHTQRKRL